MTPKIVSAQKIAWIARSLKRRGKKIVFTNGAFDILHLGHVRYLQKARHFGDVLIVGVNSDASVRSYKGQGRPVNPEGDRLGVLAALSCVDYLVLFSESTPVRLIRRILPDVLVKGADWKKDEIAGAREVEAAGGKIRRISLVKGRSSSTVIEKISKPSPAAGQGSSRPAAIPSWKVRVYNGFKLYAVTDLKASDRLVEVLGKVEAVCRGGADIIQLRSREWTMEALYRAGLKIRRITENYQKLFFVNDRPDLALALGADGVHVGQSDLPVRVVRELSRRAGVPLWIGKSTHSEAQALAAEREGADYLSVGPVFPTPTKPDYPAVGTGLVRRAAAILTVPFVAIGGIDQTNIRELLRAGAVRIAVVRALFKAKEPCETAKKIRSQIRH